MLAVYLTGMKISVRGARSVAFIVSLFTLISCEKPVNSIEFDPPPLPDGDKELIINTFDLQETPTTGVNLSITGPQNFSGITTDTPFAETITEAGTYTVRANRSGYLESVLDVNIQSPANVKDETFFNSNIFLTPQESFKTVSNQTGGSFEFAPGFYNRIQDIPITVLIPPNAIPGTGSTTIRVNRILENDFDHPSTRTSSGAHGQDVIRMEPQGLRLNSPVTLQIPMNIPSPVIDDDFELHLHEVSRNPSTGRFNYGSERIPVSVSSDGRTGTAEIDRFASYRVVPNLDLSRSDSTSAFEEVVLGDCGESVTAEFTNPDTNIGGLMRFVAPALQKNVDNPASKTRSYDGLEGTAVRVLARNLVKTWTVRSQATGDVIDRVTVNSSPIQFRIERVTCFE